MEEIWKSIEENSDYEVSNLGNVRSLDRVVRGKDNINHSYKGKLLIPTKSSSKRLSVGIPIQGKIRLRLISRLLAIHFIPNPNNYPCVLHKDDNPLNNTLENLYWGTYKMNSSDRIKNSNYYGNNHQCSKITVAQANEIRVLIEEQKLTLRAIGAKYGITGSYVGRIKSGHERKYDSL